MEEMRPDRRVVQVNVKDGTRTAVAGARAYLVRSSGANERVELLIRSRGGRWIEKWEPISRLVNPRVVTLPPQHPVYDRDLCDYHPEEEAERLAVAIGATG